MRQINIIGCGESAQLWNGKGESLGVNDCEKTGNKVDKLLVINWPDQFPKDRLKTIVDSKAEFYSQLLAWKKYKEVNLFHMNRWRGRLMPYKINFSSTSPFVAITLAWTWGYQEITLWGVDMNNHKSYGKDNENFGPERAMYRELMGELGREGVKIYHGAPGSALNFIETKPLLM